MTEIQILLLYSSRGFVKLKGNPYAEDFGILYCFLRKREASESALWHKILKRVLESAPSLLLPPRTSRPLEDFKSSISSRVCEQKKVERKSTINLSWQDSRDINKIKHWILQAQNLSGLKPCYLLPWCIVCLCVHVHVCEPQ